MRSEVLIVARRERRPRIECAGGLAARLTGPDTVHLVSAAATPLGGDVLHFRVVVEPDARLRIRTAAATMALPGAKTPDSHAIWELDVAGLLDLDPEPTIVAADSRHHSSVRLDLGARGRVRIRERVQIGRSDERDGFWSGSLHADVDGAPLLRHRIELGRGSVTDDEIGAPMAAISELSYPDADVDTTGEPLALAAGGCLATWQGARL
ncbi:urease accessory protein UreD [Mycolicibacterium novocastrense]|uniref:urease accessory protein UreD n=1 Tax=Mycolicibacterium novocastrense TaxID=59813 RepID=UPI00074A9105|nr:urease accessory protein UreD [Mycolicibacterium novocastrense]KUH68714.1 urease accessory protein UreD [Mycolicibacterium novocastrense]KUH68774.1 urease accessory protein UreD [Mycolicibacterium novocastrense]KUH77119.1 urease accessory protein UreD [Mycolicibacterium novocastrense]